ncbi:MAG: WD40/YVTN/BNR-like repeat-containing protein, partial [bacterium]
GLLESVDEGKSWTYTDEAEGTIIYDFVLIEGYIFALGNNVVYRKHIDDNIFQKISDLSCNMSRKIVYYNNKLFIITDNGLQSSDGDVFGTQVEFTQTYSNISLDKKGICYTLNIIDDLLYIGTEDRVYVLNKDNEIWLQYENKDSIAPTIYLDNQQQHIGFYYNEQKVSFDRKLSLDNTVNISNKYDIYYVDNGGWANQKYNADFIIYINSSVYGYNTEESISLIDLFNDFTFPTYNITNSHLSDADDYKQNVLEEIDKLNDIAIDSEEKSEIINNIYRGIDSFKSQVYKEVRDNIDIPVIEIPVVKRNTTTENDKTEYEEDPTGDNVDVVNGYVYFDKQFSKYDNFNIDIKNVSISNNGDSSHKKIEDDFELFNSGLPSNLSQVYQSNINKFNIFIDKQYGGREDISPLYNSKIIIPYKEDNWFDEFNSTINFNKEYEQNIEYNMIQCPVASIEFDNNIYIVDYKDIIVIDKNTIEINYKNISLNEFEIIKNIKYKNNVLYVLTNYNIYKSEDMGNDWQKLNRDGLPSELYDIGFINNNIVLSAIDGFYCKASEYMTWSKVYDINEHIVDIISPDLLFAISPNNIYITGDGYNYSTIDLDGELTMNQILKFKSTFYIAAENGLYSGMNTLYSESPSVNKVDLDGIDDSSIKINCLNKSEDKMYVGLSDGGYYEMKDGEYNYKEYTGLNTIHNIVIVDNVPWFIGNNLLKIENIDYPIVLSKSIPF